jgi:integrase/recombinase XerC
LRRVDLAGAARSELIDGVAQLRPEDAMVEAMLSGWRAQQSARGLRANTSQPRERLVRGFQVFTNEFPWQWGPSNVDEWTLSLTSERHLAPSTIRGYQSVLRLFSEYLTDARYGWAVACEEAFGTFPVPICHGWNTIAHLNDYEGNPEARPLSRQELQRFLDYADEQVERAATSRRQGSLAAYRDATLFKVILRLGTATHRGLQAGSARLGPQPRGAGVRPLRDAAGALRQGCARAAAAAAQRCLGDGPGRSRRSPTTWTTSGRVSGWSTIRRCG